MTDQNREMQPATNGAGPLLQRDYWAVIAGSKLPPSGIIDLLAEQFPDFAPPELVKFRFADGCAAPIDVGDELDIEIRMAGECAVRVVHRDRNSLTLGTLEGHPEAGRITFGAYRNERGDVVFHIRSRARASGVTKYLEFLAGGDPMQTNTWVDFINALSNTVGSGVVEGIHVEQNEVEDEAADEEQSTPTFVAQGD